MGNCSSLDAEGKPSTKSSSSSSSHVKRAALSGSVSYSFVRSFSSEFVSIWMCRCIVCRYICMLSYLLLRTISWELHHNTWPHLKPAANNILHTLSKISIQSALMRWCLECICNVTYLHTHDSACINVRVSKAGISVVWRMIYVNTAVYFLNLVSLFLPKQLSLWRFFSFKTRSFLRSFADFKQQSTNFERLVLYKKHL